MNSGGCIGFAHSTDWLLSRGRARPGGRGRGQRPVSRERRGMNCLSTADCVLTVLTTSLNKPELEIGASRRKPFSFSLISVRFSHRWHSAATKPVRLRPTTRAVCLVARRAKSVALRSSLRASGITRPPHQSPSVPTFGRPEGWP